MNLFIFDSLETIDIPQWLIIVLIIIGIIVALWLILFLMCLSFAIVFKKKIKSISSTINMLMYQRYEIVQSLIAILKKHDIEISLSDKNSISMLERVHDFQSLPKNDRDNRVLSFVHSSHNILSLCESSSDVINDDEYVNKLVNFNDIEETYRQKSALYNSDVIGYNYWVNVKLVKSLLRIFRFNPKDLIV
ncbi:MAG TPA: hypothetical protein DDW20_03480 [Firmicutes bacterium]|nr:hypothetical protein [Bacillota bacterium]